MITGVATVVRIDFAVYERDRRHGGRDFRGGGHGVGHRPEQPGVVRGPYTGSFRRSLLRNRLSVIGLALSCGRGCVVRRRFGPDAAIAGGVAGEHSSNGDHKHYNEENYHGNKNEVILFHSLLLSSSTHCGQ